MKRAFRFRLYPTEGQARDLARTFGCVRHVWNWALDLRTRAWYDRQERISYAALDRALTTRKADPEFSWLAEASSVPLQQCLRDQQAAFGNFWAKRARYPRWKSAKNPVQSCRYTRNGFRLKDGRLWLAKMAEPLDVRWSRGLPDGQTPSSVTVSRDAAGRWHVSLLCDDPTVQPLPPSTGTVGIDLGITNLATLSTGEKIPNHRNYQRDLHRVRRAARSLARKQKGSANGQKAKLRLARCHARIADRRRDQLHQFTTRLVRENQAIAVEDLAISSMVRNRRLSRAISDVAWRELRTQLTYKCEWYGRDLRVVSRWLPSSKRCSDCGYLIGTMPLNVRTWTCPNCGTVHDRDVNAARNILAAGLAVNACGDQVRPNRAQPGEAPIREAGSSRQ